MPTPTYVALANATPNGSQSSISFSSIPSTYTDLIIVGSARVGSATTNSAFVFTFNGSSATNYSYTFLEGYSSSTFTSRGSARAYQYIGSTPGTTTTANTYNNFEIYIPNYASSNAKVANVNLVNENNSTTAWEIWATANLWALTNAITSITITDLNNFNFTTDSKFYLYGIKNS